MTINADHMSIYVAKRKNDQYREGHTSYLARSRKSSCPELLRFCRSQIHLIRLFVVLLGPNPACMGVSISTLREEFKKYIQPFVDDVSKYGTYSVRSGATSNPACRRITCDLLDMHAGWKRPSSKNRYVKHTI